MSLSRRLSPAFYNVYMDNSAAEVMKTRKDNHMLREETKSWDIIISSDDVKLKAGTSTILKICCTLQPCQLKSMGWYEVQKTLQYSQTGEERDNTILTGWQWNKIDGGSQLPRDDNNKRRGTGGKIMARIKTQLMRSR